MMGVCIRGPPRVDVISGPENGFIYLVGENTHPSLVSPEPKSLTTQTRRSSLVKAAKYLRTVDQ